MFKRHTMRFHVGLCLAVIFFTLCFVGLWQYRRQHASTVVFGATVSSVYAESLGVDVVEMYTDLLASGLHKVRLPLYWNHIETQEGVFDWTIPDALLDASATYGAEVTLVVGQRVPRWPECFVPDWVTDTTRQEALQRFLQESLTRYASRPEVVRLQIENEPFLSVFGDCPPFNTKEFTEEIALARAISDKPIQITASGELSSWIPEVLLGDVLGISLYRETWNPHIGYVLYPFSPIFYAARVSTLIHRPVVISELQAEPWFYIDVHQRPLEDWYASYTNTDLRRSIQFARQTGVSEVYVWGVEWWYALAQRGDTRLLDEGGKAFSRDGSGVVY